MNCIMGNICSAVKNRHSEFHDPFVKSGKKCKHMAAAVGSHLACLKALLDAGADVNETNETGQTALHYHCSETVENNNVNIMEQHIKCVEYLIQQGADVNIRNRFGLTPLHAAAKNGHDKCLEMFIRLGADVNNRDMNGHTALISAALHGHTKCVEALVKGGAAVNRASKDGHTPLLIVAENYCRRRQIAIILIKILLRAGAQVNKRNRNGQNALKIYITGLNYNFRTTSFRHTYPIKDTIMLLYAAGETMDEITSTKYGTCRYKHIIKQATVPTYVQQIEVKYSLKHLCRKAIRAQLLKEDPHRNLFHRIAKLKIPHYLRSYLLYDTSLDLG